mmetsp:Transcript_11028/g.28038  ORF Transcript_11028/g.28038 Transcript_11028/m.28038 type:complete len:245 (-) Transcript_11028:672-1406(-)
MPRALPRVLQRTRRRGQMASVRSFRGGSRSSWGGARGSTQQTGSTLGAKKNTRLPGGDEGLPSTCFSRYVPPVSLRVKVAFDNESLRFFLHFRRLRVFLHLRLLRGIVEDLTLGFFIGVLEGAVRYDRQLGRNRAATRAKGREHNREEYHTHDVSDDYQERVNDKVVPDDVCVRTKSERKETEPGSKGAVGNGHEVVVERDGCSFLWTSSSGDKAKRRVCDGLDGESKGHDDGRQREAVEPQIR